MTAPAADYVPPLVDAVDEAIARLGVVLRLLHQHECRTENGDEGYDLAIARDALRHVRDLLRASQARATLAE